MLNVCYLDPIECVFLAMSTQLCRVVDVVHVVLKYIADFNMDNVKVKCKIEQFKFYITVGLAPNSINDPTVDTYFSFKGSRCVIHHEHQSYCFTD